MTKTHNIQDVYMYVCSSEILYPKSHPWEKLLTKFDVK